jgi:hypothetical protein
MLAYQREGLKGREADPAVRTALGRAGEEAEAKRTPGKPGPGEAGTRHSLLYTQVDKRLDLNPSFADHVNEYAVPRQA